MTTYFDGFLKSSSRILSWSGTGPKLVGVAGNTTYSFAAFSTDVFVYQRISHGKWINGFLPNQLAEIFSLALARGSNYVMYAGKNLEKPYLFVFDYVTNTLIASPIPVEAVTIAADKQYGGSCSISDSGTIRAVVYNKYMYRGISPYNIKQYSSKVFIYRNVTQELAWLQPVIPETGLSDTEIHCVKVSPDGATVIATSFWYTHIFTYGPLPEITSITCLGAAALNGKYLKFNDTPTTTVAFFFDVNNSAIAPPVGVADRTIRVLVLSTDVATAVANKLSLKIDEDLQFNSTVAGAVLTVTHVVTGTMPNAIAGTSGFTVTVSQQGGVGWPNTYTYDSHATNPVTVGNPTYVCFEDNNSFVLFCLEGLLYFKYVSAGVYQKTLLPSTIPVLPTLPQIDDYTLKWEISIFGNRMAVVARTLQGYPYSDKDKGIILLYFKVNGTWTFDRVVYGAEHYNKSKMLYCNMSAANTAIVADIEGWYEYA